MFDNLQENIEILEGCYRKLKTYYFYNKSFIFAKEKIADFESNQDIMENRIANLASFLQSPDSDEVYKKKLLGKVSFYILPKKFSEIEVPNEAISNQFKERKIESVNYFINVPIEIMILDVLWTLLIEQNEIKKNDHTTLKAHIYGNTIHESVFKNGFINFQTRRFFKPYFNNYQKWRDNAFAKIRTCFKHSKSTILFSLDIKRFFYSVKIKQDSFYHDVVYFQDEKINKLTDIFFEIYKIYFKKIAPFNTNFEWNENTGFGLPIGLFSSMLIANLYLKKLDQKITQSKNLEYYGRYVDDILVVFNTNETKNFDTHTWIENFLISQNILASNESNTLVFKDIDHLLVQKEKIKTIFFSTAQSPFLLDFYENHFKIIPSMASALPTAIDLKEFDEETFYYGKFKNLAKPRDLDKIEINAFFLSTFFSKLCQRYSKIRNFDATEKKQIKKIITKANLLFKDNRIIEYSFLWKSYMNFLILVEETELSSFYKKANNQIESIFFTNSIISQHLKVNLRSYINICLFQTLSLKKEIVSKYKSFSKFSSDIDKFINANLFDHNLISIPLSNYFYNGDKSFIDLNFSDFLQSSQPNNFFSNNLSHKLKWNPRFLHLYEIQILSFYSNIANKNEQNENTLWDFFKKVNFIVNDFQKNTNWHIKHQTLKDINGQKYNIQHLEITSQFPSESNILVAVGNTKEEEKDVFPFDQNNIERSGSFFCNSKKYDDILSILTTLYKENKRSPYKILVLPELFLPFSWTPMLLKFAEATGTAIISGIQFIKDAFGFYHNYLLNIFPYYSYQFHGAGAFFREKNDYSPDEKSYFNQKNILMIDTAIPTYLLTYWNGLNFASMLCYELTDIFARAILKGRCDILAIPVFNRDTTYFSNIISSSVRDLHACLIQANTSKYGDSRVSMPFDRNHSDLIKVIGGLNPIAIIEEINFKELFDFQKKFDPYNIQLRTDNKSIKKPSARFRNSRTKNF